MSAAEPELHEREGVDQRQSPKIGFVRQHVASVGRGRRGIKAVVHIDGRLHPETVEVRELPRKQPGGLNARGHDAFLDQAEPAPDHAVVLRPIYARVLMADDRIPAARREHLIRELRPVVRSEAFYGVPDFGQNFRHCRGHVDRALAPEGVYPSHARRVILEQDQVQRRTHAYSSPARTQCR